MGLALRRGHWPDASHQGDLRPAVGCDGGGPDSKPTLDTLDGRSKREVSTTRGKTTARRRSVGSMAGRRLPFLFLLFHECRRSLGRDPNISSLVAPGCRSLAAHSSVALLFVALGVLSCAGRTVL